MKPSAFVLDHLNGITLDPADPPFKNYQAFHSTYVGLKILADSVRELERQYAANDPHAAGTTLLISSSLPPLIPCAFNWFATTIVNYLRLVALVELMSIQKWKSVSLSDPTNHQTIKTHCTKFVKIAIPEISQWRNKVAAHFAATYPFLDDNLATLEQSVMNSTTYHYPHFYMGMMQWNTQGQTSDLAPWALTEVYEKLGPRFWPELKLKPIKDEA